MPPAGALIFKLEQTFFRTATDYREVIAMVTKGQPGEPALQTAPTIASSMIALKKKLGKKAYAQLKRKAEASAQRSEAQALASAQMHPGVVQMLEAVRDTGWWVVAASDFAKKPVSDFLKAKSLAKYMNLVVARTRLDEERSLPKRLRPVQTKLGTLSHSVYFCNSSREVAEAKALGMKCFVLPSPTEPFRTLYQAGPNGIILSLEEIPPLLSLPAMKLPVLEKPAVKKKGRKGIKKVSAGITQKTP